MFEAKRINSVIHHLGILLLKQTESVWNRNSVGVYV